LPTGCLMILVDLTRTARRVAAVPGLVARLARDRDFGQHAGQAKQLKLARQMGKSQPAVHRTIVIVDVENFGDPARTNADQLAVRDTLYAALRRSFAKTRISWAACAIEDRGDGILVLVPPTVPKGRLVTSLPAHLAGMLARHNATHPPQERIRLRMALHAGEVHHDPHGFAGISIIRAFRLIQAPASRSPLRDPSAVLALIVSGWFYDEVVRHHPAAGPSRFRQVHVVMKETATVGWVRTFPAGAATSGWTAPSQQTQPSARACTARRISTRRLPDALN
jgi:hypothetical protein